jgi:hypothetical protein
LGAKAIAVIEQGKISEVKIQEGGTGYAEAPTVAFAGGDGFGALANAVLKKEPKPEEGMAPEQFIRLMLGPDGTLWANNKSGNTLFAFIPRYAESNLTLRQNDIKTQTVYRATGRPDENGKTDKTGKIAFESNVIIGKGTKILLQAQKRISFPKNFTVKKGASLLCRTGF